MNNDKLNKTNEINETLDDISTILSENKIVSLNNINSHVEWSSEHELILVEWADKSLCYRWLHNKSNIKYSQMNTWFTIPVIIMSTLQQWQLVLLIFLQEF